VTHEDFLAILLALTIAIGFLGLTALWCLLVPRFVRWVMRQNLEPTSAKRDRSTA
jgi:hypothetical protein